MANYRQTVVYRWLAAGDSGDVAAFDDLMHRDAVVHAPRGLSSTTREREKAVWVSALAAMPDLRHEVQEVVSDGNVEMARVVVTGTLVQGFGGVKPTGEAFRMDQAVIVHLRDGKISEAWEIADVGAIEEQSRGSAPSSEL
jgi:ketosteroid isomerase-like protein